MKSPSLAEDLVNLATGAGIDGLGMFGVDLVDEILLIEKPLDPGPAPEPFTWITGDDVKPGCVDPSITTASVIVENAESGVIVANPPAK